MLLSCGRNDESLQKIDQTLHLYIKDSAGNDLLHPSKIGSYTTISMTDDLAETNNVNVNYSRKMQTDSTYFMEYIAGSRRLFEKDSSDGSKIYKSEIKISLTKKISETEQATPDIDTLRILYRMTPSVFEVSKVYYNNSLKFSKIQDQPNVATVIK